MRELDVDGTIDNARSRQVEWENDVVKFEAIDAGTQTVLVVAVNRLQLARPIYSYRIGSYKVRDGKFTNHIPVRIDRKPVAPVLSVTGVNAALFVDLFRSADRWVEADIAVKASPDDLLTLEEKRGRSNLLETVRKKVGR